MTIDAKTHAELTEKFTRPAAEAMYDLLRQHLRGVPERHSLMIAMEILVNLVGRAIVAQEDPPVIAASFVEALGENIIHRARLKRMQQAAKN